MCPEYLCMLLIRWFVLSLGSDTGPSEVQELKTLFLAGRICPSSTVPWLCEGSGCVISDWGFGSAFCWVSEPGSALLFCVCTRKRVN